MKTTVDLPAELIERLKILAAKRRQSMKVILTQLLAAGLSAESRRVVEPPVPIKLQGRGPLTLEEIEEAINEGRS